ncbi:F-box/LRR-repeat protein 2 [Anabrus simplex]|uniref:F-box/LRR-repeat protein 2 n=1 Tax=Anabrus simplex TaxID=316456 RepID=UPI0035A29173
MESLATVNDLPDDVLVEIFSYLTFNDVIHSVQHVSCRWKIIVQYADLWRNLVYIPDFGDSDSHITSTLQQTPKLQTLVLKRRGVCASVLYTFLYNCSYLKKLEFNSEQKLSPKFLKKLVINCPNIEYLHVPNEVLSRVKCSQVIAQFKKLKTLVVGKMSHWDYPAVLEPLADGCVALKHLDLKNEMHRHDDMAYFLKQKSDQLEVLSVGWASADCKCVVPLLVSCRALKKLTVDSFCCGFMNGLEDVYIEPYFEPFWSLTSVTSLTLSSLSNAQLSDIERIFQKRAMGQLVELQIVRFKGYKDRLSNVIIENCPRLQVLHFKWCDHFTDMSVKNLYNLQELKNLDICSSVITYRGMVHLSKCDNLKYLTLSHCRELNEKGLMQLLNFKNLEVLRLGVCDLRGLPLHLFPTHLKKLFCLNINFCRNVNRKALAQLKIEMPRLIVKDRLCMSDDEDEPSEKVWWYEPVRPASENCDLDGLLEDAPFLLRQLREH